MKRILGMAFVTGTVVAAGYLDLLPLSRSRLDRATALLLTWIR